MEKKEAYRHRLPHFQQPGQAYFVTWCLKGSVPPKALASYTQRLEQLRNEISRLKIVTPGSGTGDFQLPKNIYAIANRVSQNRASQIDGTGDFQSPKNCAIENRTSQNRASLLLKEYFILRKKYLKAYDDLLDVKKSPSELVGTVEPDYFLSLIYGSVFYSQIRAGFSLFSR